MNNSNRPVSIVCIVGSPRSNGNSAHLAGLFAEQAQRAGATVRSFKLGRMTYRGCQGCLACKKDRDTCVLKDELTPVLNAVSRCDVLVLATPIYFGEVTSLVKMFIDRCFSFYLPDYLQNPTPGRLSPGKTLVFIQVQGVDEPRRYKDVFNRYEYFFKRFGFTRTHHLIAAGVRDECDALKREDLQESIHSLVDELII